MKRKFNLQLFADETPAPTIETFEVEIEGKKVALPTEVNGVNLREVYGKTIATTRKMTESKYKGELEKVNGVLANQNLTLAEKEEALRKFEEEKLSVEERLSKEYSRKEKNILRNLAHTRPLPKRIFNFLHLLKSKMKFIQHYHSTN